MSDIIVSQRTKYEVICPECGQKTKLSKKMEYGYCNICTSKISLKDAENRNISIGLISSLSGKEIDDILIDDKNLDMDKAEVASERGSNIASLFLGTHYFMKDDYKKAKVYFGRSAAQGVPDGKLATFINEIGLSTQDLDTFSEEYVQEMLKQAKAIDQSKLKYLSKNTIRVFNNSIEAVEEVVKERDISRNRKSYTSYSGSYSGGYSGSYVADQPLSNSELRELNDKITSGLWNPTAIDNSNLTDSQKEQLKTYNMIYGD